MEERPIIIWGLTHLSEWTSPRAMAAERGPEHSNRARRDYTIVNCTRPSITPVAIA